MKKWVVFTLCFAMVTAMAAAPVHGAQKKKKKPKKVERTVEFTYQCPCIGVFQLGGLTGGDPNLGGGVVQPGARELFVSGEVKDASGRPVFVSINQDTDGDGFNNDVASFCGKSEEPLPIHEGLEIRVFMGKVSSSCPGPGLGGTVTFTFTNKP